MLPPSPLSSPNVKHQQNIPLFTTCQLHQKKTCPKEPRQYIHTYCEHLDARRIGHHKLPAIPRDVVEASHFQCLQQRGLAMKPAPDHKCNAATKSHASDGLSIGKSNFNLQTWGRCKLDSITRRHGQVVRPTFSRQHRPVRNEGHQSPRMEGSTQVRLIFDAQNVRAEVIGVQRAVQK